MSQYSTGELAKQCEVSVRTVQFYDAKGLLRPSALTEGGRRLYSEEDLKQMRLIVLLKKIGLTLDSIKGILKSDVPEKVLMLLLDEQIKHLDSEISEIQAQKLTIAHIQKNIYGAVPVSVNSIRDIDEMMKSSKRLKKVHGTMLVIGILMDIVQISAVLLWIFKGIWLPFVVMLPFVALAAYLLVKFYYKNTRYICPECGTTFQPSRKEFFFAKHTPKTRKLTCTRCGHNGFCVEVANPEILQ